MELSTDKEIWDTFVDENNYSTIFHKWDFLKIIEKYTKYKLLPLELKKGHEIIGILPLFFKKNNGIKLLFSPPPNTGVPYLGMLLDNKQYDLSLSKSSFDKKLIVEKIEDVINNLSPDYCSIQLSPYFIDIREFLWNNYNPVTRYTYLLDIEYPLDVIWKSFKKNLRQEILKTEKDGIKFLINDDVSKLYQLLYDRYKSQKLLLPIINEQYLKEIYDKFKQDLILYSLIDEKEDILSSSLLIKYNIPMDWMGGTKIEKYSNSLGLWEMIKYLKKLGYKKIDMVGANNYSISQYKVKFNPNLKLRFTITKYNYLGKIMEITYNSIYKKNGFFKMYST